MREQNSPMKILLLSMVAVVAAQNAFAGDDVIAMSGSSTTIGVLRGGGNLYRPVPRGGTMANGITSGREIIYRPTQHYYLKDNVVSYRYSAEFISDIGDEYGGTYLGPHAAQFVPSEHQLAGYGTMRSYAAVNRRPQPGVPMVAKTTITKTTRSVSANTTRPGEAVSSIQLAAAQ
jgi:hypothetical protein